MAVPAGHTHIGALGLLPPVLAVVAVLGTAHLLAITYDNRMSRALLALGF